MSKEVKELIVIKSNEAKWKAEIEDGKVKYIEGLDTIFQEYPRQYYIDLRNFLNEIIENLKEE